MYSEYAKNIHIKSNFIKKNIEVVGCSRLGESFSYKNKTKKIKFYIM